MSPAPTPFLVIYYEEKTGACFYVDLAQFNIIDLLSVAGAIIFALLAAWIVMRSSLWIVRRVGRTGILVLSRILGILLGALAVQFILNGIATFAHLPV